MKRKFYWLGALLATAITILLWGAGSTEASSRCFVYSPAMGVVCNANRNAPIGSALPLMERHIVNESRHAAYVKINDDALVYPAPDSNARPLYDLGSGFIFLETSAVLDERVEGVAERRWYRINPGRYIKAESIEKEVRPSTFQGRAFTEQPPRPFGWIVTAVRPSSHPGGPANPDLPFLTRYRFFEVYGAADGGDGWLWYNVGDGAWVHQHKVSLVDPKARPGGVGEGHYWVEVDLYEQSFAAYQGSRLVYAGLISSGLPRSPTREGLFQVWSRHTKGKMSGFEGYPEYYYLQNVPHIQYFDGSIGLHNAYWHDRFGFRASRGCVNMTPKDAEWLFNWSARAPNTLWVWVHTSNPRHYFDRH